MAAGRMSKARKLVMGVGVNDADYTVKISKEHPKNIEGKRQREIVFICPFYAKWKAMLDRCYGTSHHKSRPGYAGCSVSEEWKIFSNFKKWMESQDWEGRHLDKDILFQENKIYSSETCVLILPLTNTFINSCERSRGKYLLGVSWDTKGKKYRARVHNPFTDDDEWLGMYKSEAEAHSRWRERKLELAGLVADKEQDGRVRTALLKRYENLKENENE